MSEPTASLETARFVERPTEPIVRDGLLFGLVPLVLSGGFALAGLAPLAWASLALSVFVAFFFRNPHRDVPGDERSVVSPADGHVIEVGVEEDESGAKRLRIGIFLSVFDVHVNRCPVSGRVVAVERSPGRTRAAFRADAARENARCTLRLETPGGERVDVVQIVGWVARRIICHPRAGEVLGRGERYGLIRFGSRTDVVLPGHAESRVSRGQRVRGGASEIAWLEGGA